MAGGAFLTAEWRALVMLNFVIDPARLRALVPAGTELDLWKGEALVSVVGFRFLRTRVFGLAIPWHRDFDEVNLRFYVRHRAEKGWRRGVVFVKEIVPRRAIATVARVFYNENYVALPMRHDVARRGAGISAKYAWSFRGREHELSAKADGEPREIESGSGEEFITEHYWGYTRQRGGGGTLEYEVAHPRWRVWRAEEATFRCDAREIYGEAFGEALGGRPASAFIADGSAVTVFRGRKISVEKPTR